MDADEAAAFAQVRHHGEVPFDGFELGGNVVAEVLFAIEGRVVAFVVGHGPEGFGEVMLHVVEPLERLQLGFAEELLAVGAVHAADRDGVIVEPVDDGLGDELGLLAGVVLRVGGVWEAAVSVVDAEIDRQYAVDGIAIGAHAGGEFAAHVGSVAGRRVAELEVAGNAAGILLDDGAVGEPLDAIVGVDLSRAVFTGPESGGGEREHVAVFGGVDEDFAVQREAVRGAGAGDRAVTVEDARHAFAEQQVDAAGLLHHVEQDLLADLGFEAVGAVIPVAGVDALAEPGVVGFDAGDEFLVDAGVEIGALLIHGGDGCGGHLAADPIGLFEQGNGSAHARGLDGGGSASAAGAHDDHVIGAGLRGQGKTGK